MKTDIQELLLLQVLPSQPPCAMGSCSLLRGGPSASYLSPFDSSPVWCQQLAVLSASSSATDPPPSPAPVLRGGFAAFTCPGCPFPCCMSKKGPQGWMQEDPGSHTELRDSSAVLGTTQQPGALSWRGPRSSSPTPGFPHSLPSWGTYICPASAAEMLDGRPDSGQRLPLSQVEKLEVVVKGREGLKGKRQKCH